MSKDTDLAGHIIQRLMPYGIEVSTGFDNVMGFRIYATKSFPITPTDYMNLLLEPRAFEERVRSELGMLNKPRTVIQRVGRINTDYWASSPNARRKR